MDVGLYISELLNKNSEINIPGVGFLVQERVSAYYNEAEGKFYPPHYRVSFNPQYIEDNTLPQYIADQKHISLSSAAYFTEKYIENLKHDILTGDVAMADLGWFYMDQSTIAFRPNNKTNEGVDLYGFQPVELKKESSTYIKPSIEEESAAPESIVTQTEQENHSVPDNSNLPDITFTSKGGTDETNDDDRFPSVLSLEKKKPVSETPTRSYKWLFIIIGIVLIAAVLFFTVKQFAPATYQKLINWEHKIRGIKTTDSTNVVTQPIIMDKHPLPTVDTVKKDSTLTIDTGNKKVVIVKHAATATVVKPTAEVKPTAPAKAGTGAPSHFEIIIGSSPTISGRDQMIAQFKKSGVNASEFLDFAALPTPPLYVKFGDIDYDTFDEANNEMNQLKKEHKIPATSRIIEIKPKK